MDQILSRQKMWQIIRCCYGYAVSGMAVLAVGAVLPSLIEEANLSYSMAGGMISLMAIGNLAASFVFPAVILKIGRRLAITIFAALVPISYLILLMLPPVWLIYCLMFLMGIARGSITFLNNLVVDEVSGHSTKMLNYLHCSFAIGAFLSPFFTAFAISMGYGWRTVAVLLVVLCCTSTVFYATGNYDTGSETKEDTPKKTGRTSKGPGLDFYLICLVLFFYIGLENCVNGWFVTYLQSMGIMSASFATTMVSITWLVIMAGRLLCAWLARRYSKTAIILACTLGTGASFLLLICSNTIVPVAIALIGTGFFMSGIYPTSVAHAGPLFQGSAIGMSVLTAVASIGGILTPQIVGSAADRVGMSAAISILLVNGVMMCLLSFINFRRAHKQAA